MLHIDNVSKKYGKETALDGVSLSIPAGICFGLAGPNGAGKSTLLKIITSIIQSDGGTMKFHQKKLQQIKQKIGYVPQEICLEQSLTALQNLYFFGRLYGLRKFHLKQRAETVLAYIGLAERGNNKVSTFSGGMKRRLNIGCALMNEPEVIIMDEPTVGIDPQSRQYIFDMIEKLKQEGRTVIYASHYMEEIEKVCDEVAFIDHGKIVESGPVDELLIKYATPSVYVEGQRIDEKLLESVGNIHRKQDGFLIMTRNPLLAMEKILVNCRKQASPLKKIELVQPRMEDVFFSLTSRTLRE
ncbi:ABC transporter ATP-binding protein [Virgibacillus sp. W0181]|uniref:ABC transporter ATP-binding protein n=1 Tax=Virgibacillus sp. W0181 TaxID=3391581 RepID=UPI003F480381